MARRARKQISTPTAIAVLMIAAIPGIVLWIAYFVMLAELPERPELYEAGPAGMLLLVWLIIVGPFALVFSVLIPFLRTHIAAKIPVIAVNLSLPVFILLSLIAA